VPEVDESFPEAPEFGAPHWTVAPLTGCPPQVTVATSGLGNFVPTWVLCPPPDVALITSVQGGAVFVRLKSAGWVEGVPGSDAVAVQLPTTLFAHTLMAVWP
jgi:hypothetical protein